MEGSAAPVSRDRMTILASVFAELSLYARGLKTFSFLALGPVTLSQGFREKTANRLAQLARDLINVAIADSIKELEAIR
jgi:hypothetical protein